MKPHILTHEAASSHMRPPPQTGLLPPLSAVSHPPAHLRLSHLPACVPRRLAAPSPQIRPIVQRSVCIQRIVWLEPDDNSTRVVCPRWKQAFARQLPFFLDTGPFASFYHPCVESQIGLNHPCKNVTAQGCRESLISALG